MMRRTPAFFRAQWVGSVLGVLDLFAQGVRLDLQGTDGTWIE